MHTCTFIEARRASAGEFPRPTCFLAIADPADGIAREYEWLLEHLRRS
ncbi:MAG TPA: hypothetical protein VM389_14835 [Phycisphaerae bacterium]|nr:hypothetical protein [Phycisphaerae bacterium]